jgi:hypothetical protein
MEAWVQGEAAREEGAELRLSRETSGRMDRVGPEPTPQAPIFLGCSCCVERSRPTRPCLRDEGQCHSGLCSDVFKPRP